MTSINGSIVCAAGSACSDSSVGLSSNSPSNSLVIVWFTTHPLAGNDMLSTVAKFDPLRFTLIQQKKNKEGGDQSVGSKDKDRQVHMSVAQPSIMVLVLFQPMGGALLKQQLHQAISSSPNAFLSKQWALGCNSLNALVDFICRGRPDFGFWVVLKGTK